MKNRAKCKLCKEIIESHFLDDMVECKCGEISVSGGELKNWCAAKNWENFLRIDDEGNEIVPKIKEKEGDVKPLDIEPQKVTREDKIEMLNAMIKSTEDLPQGAMTLPISQYDFISLMMLLYSILKEE